MKLYINPLRLLNRGKKASVAITRAANQSRGRYCKRNRKDWKEHVRLAQEKGRLAQKEATKYMTQTEKIEYYKRKREEGWRDKSNRNKRATGENSRLKISDEGVIKLRKDYEMAKKGLVTYEQLAILYGISTSYCVSICRGHRRRNVRSKNNE